MAASQYRVQLEQLRNLVAVSKGALALDRVVKVLRFQEEDDILAFFTSVRLKGISVDWSARELIFTADDVTQEIDKLLKGFEDWEQNNRGKIENVGAPAHERIEQTQPPSQLIPIRQGETEQDQPPSQLIPTRQGTTDNVGEPPLVRTELEQLLGESISSFMMGGRAGLDLSGRGLTSLPDTIGNLTTLQTLDLNNNLLTTLPESIGNLSKLERLHLRENQLWLLPKTIGNLHSLQSLDLSKNKLENLPETLGQLTSLRTLDLSENHLADLPETVRNLAKLERLNLTNTRLWSLSKPAWRALKEFRMRGCKVDGYGEG